MTKDLNKIPTIDELRIALEKCGCSLRPYDLVLLNNYLENLTIEDQGNANIVKYTNVSELPNVGDDDTLYVIINNSLLYVWDNGAYLQMPGGGGGGGGGTIATWGDIIGNILHQQDLAMALNAKVDKVSGKQLSSEDYTLAEKNKLASAITSETDPTVPSWAKQATKPVYTKAEIEAELTGTITTHSHSIEQIADFPEKGNLVAGSNIIITEAGGNITISSTGGGGGGVSVHNDLAGRSTVGAHPISAITGLEPLTNQIENASNLVAGTNITLTLEGNNLTISSSGGGGGGSSIHNDLTGRDTANAHPISAITGLQTIASSVQNAGNLVAGTNMTFTPDGNDLIISSSGGGGGGSSDWEDITNKPATFAPSAHVHAVGDVTGLETTLTGLEDSVDNASILVAGNNITLTPSGNNITISASGGLSSVAWEDVTNKPASFAPDAHNHSATEISSGVLAVARLGTGTPSSSNYLRGDGTWVVPPNDDTIYTGSTSITLAGNSIQRAALTGDVTSPLDSNVTTLSSTGVSAGTYNNTATSVSPFTVDVKGRITSVGAAVTIAPAWGSVSGKPATFAPSAHNHAAGEITSGTLGIDRIPTGSTASTVSLGNHSHTEIDGALDLSTLPGYSGTVKQYLVHDSSGVLKWENS